MRRPDRHDEAQRTAIGSARARDGAGANPLLSPRRRGTGSWARIGVLLPLAALALLGGLPTVLALADIASDGRDAWAAVRDPLLYARLVRTLGIGAAVLGLSIALGLAQGWLLVRSDLPGRRLWSSLLPLPLFLPPLVHVLAWFQLLDWTGSKALIAVYTLSLGPLCTLMALRAFEQVSREQAEANLLLGGRGALLAVELREALPAALVGAALVLVLLLSDFAVADFVTSVGPKTVVYADSLYAHHVGGRRAAAAAAALPGLLVAGLALGAALWARRRLGWAVGMRFVPAEPLALGAARWPLALCMALLVGGAAVLPFVALAVQTGSLEVLQRVASQASERIVFSILLAAGAATGMVLLAAPLALLARRLRRPLALDLLVFLPLAVPALSFGIGLVRQWNHAATEWIYQGLGVALLAVVGRYLALAYLPVCGTLERIDRRLEDAARLAGAGRAAVARSILLPLAARALVAAWCLSFAFTLRELDALIMLRAAQSSLTFQLYSNVVFARQEEIAALALVLALVTAAPLILFLSLTRRSLRLS